MTKENQCSKIFNYFKKFLFEISVSIFLMAIIALSITNRNVYANNKSFHLASHNKASFKKSTFLLFNSLHSPKSQNRHQLYVSKKSKVPVYSDGQSALPSGSDDFYGKWQASVNPRTGMPFFTITLGNILYDAGKSSRSLSLTYTGRHIPTGPNPFTIGSNWGFNIAIERESNFKQTGRNTIEITTGEGHRFVMAKDTKNPKQPWHLLKYKLKNINIKGNPGDWLITLSSGNHIHIKNGYEDWEETPQGSRLWFYYTKKDFNKNEIRYICPHQLSDREIRQYNNVCKDGIKFTWKQNLVTIDIQQKIQLHKSNIAGINEINKIDFPSFTTQNTQNSNKTDSIRFEYDLAGKYPWLITNIKYPAQASATFLYNNESSKKTSFNGLPIGINNAFLPVVSEEILRSGNKAIPDKHFWFSYGNNSKDEHNYTGYQLSKIITPGEDNLYDRPSSYKYSVSINNGITKTTTTYNKYHLPLLIKTINVANKQLTSIKENTYPQWENTKYSDLPSNFSLPIKTTVTLFSNNASKNKLNFPHHKLVQIMKYDDQGRLIWDRSAANNERFIQYCPSEGNSHCPQKIPNYPDISLPEKIILIPFDKNKITSNKNLKNKSQDEEAIIEQVFDYVRVQRNKNQTTDQKKQFSFGELSPTWKIKSKKIGILPISALSTIQADQPLPDLKEKDTVTTTMYQYNLNTQSPLFSRVTKIITLKSINNSNDEEKTTKKEQFINNNYSEAAIFNIKYNISSNNENLTTQVFFLNLSSQNFNLDSYVKNWKVSEPEIEDYIDPKNQAQLNTITHSLKTGLILENVDNMKNIKTQWIYDNWHRIVARTSTPSQGAKPQETTWQYILNDNDTSIIMTDPFGNQQKRVISTNGETISTWHRFNKFNKKTIYGFDNWIPNKSYSYTSSGKVASYTQWHALTPQNYIDEGKATSITTRYGYDATGRPVWVWQANNLIAFTINDDTNLRNVQYTVLAKNKTTKFIPLIKVVQSDINGRIIAKYLISLNPIFTKNQHPLYDKKLQQYLIETLKNTNKISSLQQMNSPNILPTNGSFNIITFIQKVIQNKAWISFSRTHYDLSGHPIEQIDNYKTSKKWTWKKGDLVSTTYPNGNIIRSIKNIQNKPTTICLKPYGEKKCYNLGRRAYNSVGDLTAETNSSGVTTLYKRDNSGRVLSVTQPDSDAIKHTVSWRYNNLGPIEKKLDGKIITTYKYSPVTWNLTDSEDNISHSHFIYDTYGRLSRVIYSAPQKLSSPKQINYPDGEQDIKYDNYNIPVYFKTRSGYKFYTLYDKLQRPTKKYVILPNEKSYTLLSSIEYDDYSRPSKITNGVNIIRLIKYNNLGGVLMTSDYKEASLIQKLQYIWNPETGNLDSKIISDNQYKTTISYTYDKVNNLSNMKCETNGANKFSQMCPRDTDLNGSSLSTPPMILSQNYTFNKWNNIEYVYEKLLTSNGTVTNKTIRYFHTGDNNANLNKQISNPFITTAIETKWNGLNYNSYPKKIIRDELGRITQDTQNNSFKYDALGHMVSFLNNSSGELTRYTYNAEGHQIASQIFDKNNKPIQAPLYMIYQGNMIVSKYQRDEEHHLHVITELSNSAQAEDGKITKWYTHNYKGDVLTVINNQRVITAKNLYSPYGMQFNVLSYKTQSSLNFMQPSTKYSLCKNSNPGFNGQTNDPTTGYQFLGGGYRAYNPNYRQFMSQDSFSPFTTISPFGFANNNPIMNTDPTGHLSTIGYVSGALTIGLSMFFMAATPIIAMSYLSGYAVSLSTAVNASSIIGTLVTTAVGITAGSLQIAQDRNPKNGTISVMNGVINVAGALLGIGYSTGAISAGYYIYNKSLDIMGIFILSAGITGGLTSVSQLSGGVASFLISNKRNKQGSFQNYQNSITYINYTLSIFSVVTSFFLGAVVLKKTLPLLWGKLTKPSNINLEDVELTNIERNTETKENTEVENKVNLSEQVQLNSNKNSVNFTQKHNEGNIILEGMHDFGETEMPTLILYLRERHPNPRSFNNAIDVLSDANMLTKPNLRTIYNSLSPYATSTAITSGQANMAYSQDTQSFLNEIFIPAAYAHVTHEHQTSL